MYDKLYEFLDSIHVSDISDLSCYPGKLEKLNEHISHLVSDEIIKIEPNSDDISTPLLSNFAALGGLKLMINGNLLRKQEIELQGNIVKKLACFSSISYIKIGMLKIRPSDSDTYWKRDLDCFLMFILRYRKAIQNNIVVPVPNLRLINRAELIDYFFNALIPIDLEYEPLKNQLLELPNYKKLLPTGMVGLYLPHLSNIPLEAIIHLRDKEMDAFNKYQRILEVFFKKSKDIKNETVLLDCMKEVDEGIRETQEKFIQIQRRNIINGISIVLSLATIGLSIYAPKEIQDFVKLVAAGVTGASFGYFAKENLRIKKNIDFYFPWLLSRRQ
jgi:hypothetical protein